MRVKKQGRMKILFVCMGNICRSPLAEGLFRKLVEQMGIDPQFESTNRSRVSWVAP